MQDKQLDALRLADRSEDSDPDFDDLCGAANLLRAQHEVIERKDALLRQALEILSCHIEYDWHGKPLNEIDAEAYMLADTITKELAK